MKKNYKFGLRMQVVAFMTAVSIITYSTSLFFILVLYPIVSQYVSISQVTFTIITLMLGIFWTGVLGFFAAYIIVKPLQRLKDGVERAATGEISDNVIVAKADNEIRALGLAFNKMLENLREMVGNIENNFEHTNEKVKEIMAAATNASDQAENVAKTIEEIAHGAERSASAVQTTSDSINQVTEIAQDVQQNAEKTNEHSKQMVKTLEESKEVVQSLISGMQQLTKNNEEIVRSVTHLEQNANEVEKIIGLVGDIAEQTNLLALNASIEAARAGEQGRGFAVVADEVRKLADESYQAVQGITQLIHTMQQDVKKVVEQIHLQVQSGNEEAAKGTQTTIAMDEMSGSVLKMEQAVREIAQLAEKQMEGIRQTAVQAQEVSAIAEETSAGSEEVAAAIHEQTYSIENLEVIANELNEQAEQLKSHIERFKIRRNDDNPSEND